MKKIIASALILCLVLSCAVFCSAENYTLGMGISVSTDSSKAGNAQVDATVAAVVTDSEGKIVACRLDVAQNKMDISDATVDTEKSFLTKVELGDDYGMVAYGAAIAEWYQQAAAFEQYVLGKTGEEVAAIETVVNESGHHVSVDETLLASCTMSISDFIEAVSKACADDQAAAFAAENFKLGLACNTTAEESTDYDEDEEEDGVVKMYTDFAAAAVAEDGTILAALTDCIQPQISYDEDGEITEAVFKGTKRELKEGYNMVAFGNAIAEWYQQAKAFTDFAAGKTADEVLAFETTVNESGHTVAVDETLFASCTMSISGMQAVVAKAANSAK